MLSTISEAEKAYVRAGCQAGIREDGRAPRDHRAITVEVDVLPHLNGSSRVQIADGAEVLCSIKAEVQPLAPHVQPQRGNLEVSAEFSPSCNVKLDDRKLANVGSHLSQQLQNVLLHAMDDILQQHLVIIPGRYCWCLHIDLLITRLDGDPLDACSMAIYTALKATKIPKLEPVTGPSGHLDDFEVVGNTDDATSLPVEDVVPICTTFAKIHHVFVVDASGSEQACASTALTVTTDRKSKYRGVFKLHGGGTFTEEELSTILKDADGLAPSLFNQLDQAGR